MKKLLFTAMLALAIAAGAQTPTVTTPQSVTTLNFFNGVSTAQTSSNFTNMGQTVHFVFYQMTGSVGNPTGVQIRIEGSFDGTNYFPISDDGTEKGQNQTGLLLAIGAFPFIRANLLKCTGCDANDTITASYTGTSAIPGNPFGQYGAGQQIRKVAFVGVSTDTTVNSTQINTPYGSAAGFLVVTSSVAFAASSNIFVRIRDNGQTTNLASFVLPTSGALNNFVIPIAATPATVVDVRYSRVGSPGGTFSVNYFFYPPGGYGPPGMQPSTTNNSEATAVNATASVTLTPATIQRGHVFSISGRCSAGTAQLLVVDTTTSTNLWTSAATEVGTTTFKYQWNPGLAGAPGDTVQVQLTTCGPANTGTLDVQGSVF
jgi:hypothetical protein